MLPDHFIERITCISHTPVFKSMTISWSKKYASYVCSSWNELHVCAIYEMSDMSVQFMKWVTCLYNLWNEWHVCTIYEMSDMSVRFMKWMTCLYNLWNERHVCTVHEMSDMSAHYNRVPAALHRLSMIVRLLYLSHEQSSLLTRLIFGES